ncbi:MAG: hypothetical protein KDA25_07415 [Phycisphaerales bacterium]|nr:hypothetical protein [Phycisphaerales bacterium]
MLNQPVLITTAHRGVFFGTLTEWDVDRQIATLTDARNCFYWSKCGGFLDLAASGPRDGSKVGAAVASLVLPNVTSIAVCSAAAAAAWREIKVWTE